MDCRSQDVLNIIICMTGLVDYVRDWRVSKESSGLNHSQTCESISEKTEENANEQEVEKLKRVTFTENPECVNNYNNRSTFQRGN